MLNDLEFLKKENEIIQEFFNSNDEETHLKRIKEVLTNYVQKNLQNGSSYFIQFLDYFSKCRTHQQQFFTELIHCIISCYPEEADEIHQFIKIYTDNLKNVLFPEECLNKPTELCLFLQKDDCDGFVSFLSKNPTIDITKEQELQQYGSFSHLFKGAL